MAHRQVSTVEDSVVTLPLLAWALVAVAYSKYCPSASPRGFLDHGSLGYGVTVGLDHYSVTDETVTGPAGPIHCAKVSIRTNAYTAAESVSSEVLIPFDSIVELEVHARTAELG